MKDFRLRWVLQREGGFVRFDSPLACSCSLGFAEDHSTVQCDSCMILNKALRLKDNLA